MNQKNRLLREALDVLESVLIEDYNMEAVEVTICRIKKNLDTYNRLGLEC